MADRAQQPLADNRRQSSISMAKSASATDMIPSLAPCEDEPLLHGGDLGAARRLFPGAPEPFIDLSTGINPNPYPLPRFVRRMLFARLPDAGRLAVRSPRSPRRAYGAPSAAHVVAGAGHADPAAAGRRPWCGPGRAAVLSPTYAEHRPRRGACRAQCHGGARASALLATRTSSSSPIPTIPTAGCSRKDDLLRWRESCAARGGVLVVDEAFMDVGPPGASLAADVARGNIVVLRSFGKFFGLAGLRLGFALAAPADRGAARAPCLVPGRCRDRRLRSAPRRWPMRRGSSRRASGLRRVPQRSSMQS